MSRIIISETTVSGEALNTFVMSPAPVGDTQSQKSLTKETPTKGRIDVIPPASHDSNRPTSAPTTLARKLLGPFLPVGYPDSVTPDYTPYQGKPFPIVVLHLPVAIICDIPKSRANPLTVHPVFDSLQALFSTSASLLASRAVLTTLGVGSSEASTAFAMYLSIAQSTLSNLTSILFAHRFSTAISQHVKFYRFFADIVNDTAFVLDVLSPSLPEWGRVPTLCAASCCRAVCGVSGGASKAVLSGHFSKGGNVGELAAKDGSQEVLINLVGMWLGGAVVGRIEGTVVTWTVLALLLAGHLWCNWMAVASVRLRSLGGQRASIIVARLMDNDHGGIGVEEVGKDESILSIGWTGKSNVALHSHGRLIGTCCFGGFRDLLNHAGWSSQAGDRAYVGDAWPLQTLIEIFKEENYLLWWDRGTRRGVVVLKAGGDVACQLKAMCHAWRIAGYADRLGEKAATIDIVRDSLVANRSEWERLLGIVRAGGWDIEASSVAADSGTRFEAKMQS